jgi:plastocyanin
MRTNSIAASLAIAAVALGGCGGGSSNGGSQKQNAQSTGTVDIKGFKFVPATITVRAGGTLRFVNSDRAEHTATGNATGSFDSGTLRQGQSKSVTLAKAGTFSYRCGFHPFMTGEVVVVK